MGSINDVKNNKEKGLTYKKYLEEWIYHSFLVTTNHYKIPK
jgi:hypothetical protein